MKLTVSLLLVVMASVVGVQALAVSFMVDVLSPDLEAILKYHTKTGNYNPAYIYWPNSITLRVVIEDKQLLKIDGKFKSTEATLFAKTRSGLYYSNETFYFKTTSGDFRPLREERIVSYTQPASIQEAVPYLTIKYFSLREMQPSITSYYSENQQHFDTVLEDNPAIILFRPQDLDHYFMEYIFKSKKPYPEIPGCAIQVLVGVESKRKVALQENKWAQRLVFDMKTLKLTIPTKRNVLSEPIANVFGVRMATAGCITEEEESRSIMIPSHELDLDSEISKTDVIPKKDFLEKLRLVEPRLRYRNAELPKKRLLNEAQLQIRGFIWKKKINYSSVGIIDKNCPIVIELDNYISDFSFRGQDSTRLCTNETDIYAYE